jgi:hypothetical protein
MERFDVAALDPRAGPCCGEAPMVTISVGRHAEGDTQARPVRR